MLTPEEQKVYDFLKEFRPDMKDEDRIKLSKDVAILVLDGKFHPDQEEAGLSDEETIKNIVEDIETENQKIDADAVYDEMAKELEEDAKLSTEKRKSLSSSTFCGPDRSFPVPDCAHVTAARRLIGRYKGPGDKTKILACVSRKAKALGCNSSDSDPIDNHTVDTVKMDIPTCEMITTLEDKEAKTLFNMLETLLIDRKLTLTRPCAKCAEANDRANTAIADKKTIEDKLKELQDQLKYLRAELKDQYVEYAALLDENVKVRAELTGEKIERLGLVGRLLGEFKSLDEAKEGLKEANLEEKEAVFKDSFDVEKIFSKLNDGMDHTPSGDQVDNPGLPDDKNNNKFMDNLNDTQKAIIQNIKNFIKNGDEKKAFQHYGKMVSMKIIDSEQLPFNMIISAEAQKDTQAE